MILFKRKKKQGSAESFKFVNEINLPLTSFGNNISKSDVVKIAIDRIASQCAKLKPRYIKKANDKTVTEKSGKLSFILKHQPNEVMTPYQFIYMVITTLLMNDNAFIYPMFDGATGEIRALYPLKPSIVEPIIDSGGSYYLKFSFDREESFTIPYENIIHIKRFYHTNQIFGGSSSKGDQEALLKTIQINENVLQGIDNALKSSMQIKGLLKMSAMLSETDKKKQLDSFNEILKESIRNKGSSIIPVDLKGDYVPLTTDPKLIDKDTLEFLQSKILDYFGVSVPIFNSKYTEDEFNSFYEQTIEPLAIQMSEAFSLGLLTQNEIMRGEEIIFYSERLQYASWNTKVTAIEKLMGLGIMSLNESRGLLGLEPVENGDRRLQSLNYVDATKANEYQVGKDDLNEGND
ncbi:HK97 family phage portal protein [Acholeplasma morum]|uniref:phage portal protein n=1 Tax=Paracholeplasma morum TaxID=264637 RepID=UPI00195AAA77|nr:phage portal protein [Paracholeplasma morum]MBM7453919.1 HK97 family phage portal protein [Paracholeplasma morum]